MSLSPNPFLALLSRFAGGLRFPYLFGLVGLLFLFDVVIPDFIPFIDEVMLALLTLLVGSLRRKPVPENTPESDPIIDVGDPHDPSRP